MIIHNISVEKHELDKIIHDDQDFIIVEKKDFKKGDLINFDIKYYNSIFVSLYVFQIKEIIEHEALKENYCILVIKLLK